MNRRKFIKIEKKNRLNGIYKGPEEFEDLIHLYPWLRNSNSPWDVFSKPNKWKMREEVLPKGNHISE